DDLADRRGWNLPRLVLHFVGNAEFAEHLGRDIDAAGAVRIGDGLHRQQGALERLRRGNVWLRRARFYGDRDRRFDEINFAVGDRLAVLDEVVKRIADHDQDVR